MATTGLELRKELLLSGLAAGKEAYELGAGLQKWETLSGISLGIALAWAERGEFSLSELCEMLALMPAYTHRHAKAVAEMLGATEDPHWIFIRYKMGKAAMSRHSPLPSAPK